MKVIKNFTPHEVKASILNKNDITLWQHLK